MTSSPTDSALDPGARTVSNSHGVCATDADSGCLERLLVADCSIRLYPGTALADGAAGLWLRRRNSPDSAIVSLIGQTTPTVRTGAGASATDRTGCWGELVVSVSLRLPDHRAASFWHVSVTNSGTEPVELDLVAAQDVAGHGVALGVRQNMPWPTPSLLIGCLGKADRWATDAIQLNGRGRPETAPWAGLTSDLPAERQQAEHTVAALQTRPAVVDIGTG